MTTSGTVGSTVIDTVKVIDHAVRRCGLSPATLTPEQVETAQDCLHLLISSLSNRGINLWCIDEELLALSANKAKYFLTPGTLDILNVNYVTSSALAHTGTFDIDRYTAQFSSPVAVKLIGLYFNATRDHDFIAEVSNDGVTWAKSKNFGTVKGLAGQWFWAEIDPAYAVPFFRLVDTREDENETFTSLGIDTVRLSNGFQEIPMSQMSRDTYNSLPSKRTPGRPDQYYFNKQIDPELTLWPEPSDTTAFVRVRRQRQVQDVGTLQQTLEIPSRWYEPVIWKLASVLAFELENVEEKRRLECAAFAATSISEAENTETDGSPFYMRPNISSYTR
jgi:hypothetical protein